MGNHHRKYGSKLKICIQNEWDQLHSNTCGTVDIKQFKYLKKYFPGILQIQHVNQQILQEYKKAENSFPMFKRKLECIIKIAKFIAW